MVAYPPLKAVRYFEAAARHLSIATRGGPIVVSVLPSVAAKWLVPKLHDFRVRHADIDVRISATSRVETIGEGDIDIAIRFGSGNWNGVTAELLLANDLFPVCSPKLPTADQPLKEP